MLREEINEKNIYEIVAEKLMTCDRYVSNEGKLLKTNVYSDTMTMNKELIQLLLKDEVIKNRFFTKVEDTYVFDKQAFAWFIESKEFLPDSYTKYENKIGLTLNRKFISQNNDVVLDFPYKDCVLEGGQTKENQKRNEIFYNEIIASDEITRMLDPKVFTNAKRYTKNGVEENIEFNEDDNLIIKGNNLIALASLLKRYEGKIKCIYIDPPYNPTSNANTFAYNNTFNRSTWLTFMKNRLELAKRFLTSDGVLIVAIDKNEQPRLQILIEEIYPEYDTDCITVVHNPRGTIGKNFSYTHEFAIFVTPRNKKTICDRELSEDEIEWSPLRNWGSESLRTDAKNCFYPIIIKDEKIVGFGDVSDNNYHPTNQTEKIGNQYYVYPIDTKGIERKWRYSRQTVESIWKILRVKKIKNGYDIEIGKNFGSYKTVWDNSKYDANINGTQLLRNILPNTNFSYPKSVYTVMECVSAVTKNDKNAIILDFFSGSGTTGQAVMKINKDGGKRKYILIEQMDYIETDTLKRNVNIIKEETIDTSICYCELKENGQRLIDDIMNATEKTIQKIKDKIYKDDRIIDYITKNELKEAEKEFNDLNLEDKKKALIAIVNKNKLYVNLCDIDDENYNVSVEEKKFTKSFYGVDN